MGVVGCYYRYMRQSHYIRIALLGALCLHVGACGDPAYTVGSNAQCIVGGHEVGLGPTYSTVSVHYGVGEPTCTGTYIAPGVVLTAAHCGNPAYVKVGNVVRSNIMYVPHPQYAHDGLVNDVAIMFLDGELPSDIATLGSATLGSATIQGYGYDETCSYGTLRETTVFVERIMQSKLQTSAGSDACYGDSGGPMYQGSALVAIVTSGLPGFDGMDACGPGGLYTLVDTIRPWLDSEVEGLNWVSDGLVR